LSQQSRAQTGAQKTALKKTARAQQIALDSWRGRCFDVLTARQPGYQIVQLFGLIAIGLMISALAIDFSYYYTAYNVIHTAADSAALAAATELYRDRQPSPKVRLNDARAQAQQYLMRNQPNLELESNDLVFGFIDPATKVYNRATFATPTANPNYAYSHGYNGVWVRVNKSLGSANGQLNTIMAHLIGIHKMNMHATAVAVVDQSINSITNGGVRPIYACEAQVDQAMQDGVLENNSVRIYADHVSLDGADSTDGCPPRGSGTWSFADFSGCKASNLGASTMNNWFAAGYRGTVSAEQCYATQAGGDFISQLAEELNRLSAHGTVFPIPIYNSWAGSDSGAHVNLNGFVGFKISRLVNTGPVAERYIEGHFARYFCNEGCRTVGAAIARPAGSVVKVRLAYRS